MENPPVDHGGFFLYLGLIFGYYRFWVIKDFAHDIDSFRSHLAIISERLGDQLEKVYPERLKVERLLKRIAGKEHIRINIYDIDGNRLFEMDRRRESGMSNIDQKSFIIAADNAILILELSYPFSIKNFSEINAVKRLLRVSVLLFVGFLIVIAIYLHYSLVKPLTVLNNCLETFNPRYTEINNPFERQDELGELGQKYEQMLKRLKEANQQQTEMIASISHDLKTPLTSIIGYLERLSTGKVTSPTKREEYERTIYQKALDMQGLIDEFKQYTLNDMHCAAGNRESVRLHDFFAELCQEYQSELEIQKIQVEFQNQLPISLEAKIDLPQIRRLFANLVENAIRYAAGLSQVRLTAKVHQGFAVFRFEDNGQGVPVEELEAIFERFYRVEKSRSRENGGSGLGLAICRTIVESHGGNIAAYQSASGGLGIRFTLKID